MKKRPKVVKKGYINIYSKLSPQENRQIYYKTLYKKQHPDWDDTLVYLSEKLNKYLNKGSTLLDIGCGNGSYLVDENRSKIGKAIGIDVDRKSVEKNVSMDEIKITAGDTFPFKDNSFDFTVSLWLLEHLVAPKLHFSEVNRVLKKGGKYLFATPNTCYPPLYINKLLLPRKINTLLNKSLFGRRESDVFDTFYKANHKKDIKSLVGDKFKIVELRTNYDPSYTSFSNISYQITNFSSGFIRKLGFDFQNPHLIGILEKI